MNVCLIGADTLGNIPGWLAERGMQVLRHVTGRHAAHQRKPPALPVDTQLVILFTDYLGHNVMRHYRAQAEQQAIPVLACRRSVCALEEGLRSLQTRINCDTCPNRTRCHH